MGIIRLGNIAKHKYGTFAAAAEAMGIHRGNLSNIVNHGDPKTLRIESIERIERAFPEYNIDWVLERSDIKLKAVAVPLIERKTTNMKNLSIAILEKFDEQKDAAQAMGMDPANLTTLLRDRTPDILRNATKKKILDAFPEYNPAWLMEKSNVKLKENRESFSKRDADTQMQLHEGKYTPMAEYFSIMRDLNVKDGYLSINVSMAGLIMKLISDLSLEGIVMNTETVGRTLFIWRVK